MLTKTRLRIVALAFPAFLLAALFLYLLTQMNVVAKNPIPFDGRGLWTRYTSELGELTLKKSSADAIYKVSGLLSKSIKVNRNGMTTTPDGREAYTPFWLPFSNR